MIHNAGLLDWQAVESGSSNDIIKVKTQVGDWMVRFDRAALGISRSEEQRIMQMIGTLGVGPKIIDHNPKSGYLITEFIDQATWQVNDFKDPKKMALLKCKLDQFHTIEYDYLPSRLDHRLKLYLKTIENIPIDATTEILATIQKLDFLGFWQVNNTLFHSDLNPGNILGSSNPTIIDWEFAGQGHPLLDWLILEHETQVDLSAYYPLDINPVWINPAKRMIHAMMKLWPHESP
jgi:hypothetical protein